MPTATTDLLDGDACKGFDLPRNEAVALWVDDEDDEDEEEEEEEERR